MDKINSVDVLLEELDEVVEKAMSLPFMGGKCMIDAENVRSIIDEIRLNMPKDIKLANSIISDRKEMVESAKKEADSIVRFAEEKQRAMVAQNEITKLAQVKANEILASAQAKAKDMRRAAQEYVDELMLRVDDSLAAQLADIRRTRASLRSVVKSTAAKVPAQASVKENK